MWDEIISIRCDVFAVLAVIGGVAGNIWGGMDGMLRALVVAMIIDYATGLIVALFFQNSNKTISGGASSSVGFVGLLKKSVILLIVYLAMLIDRAMAMHVVEMGFTLGFLSNELLSITENAGLMGIRMPAVVHDTIDVLQRKSDSSTPKKRQKK